MRSLRRIWENLTGRSDARFVALLDDQVDTVVEALGCIRGALDANPRDAAGRMESLGRQGDERRVALIRELSRALTTPIDREDLFRVSRSIDDVLGNLGDFMREVELYRPADVHSFDPILDAIGGGLEKLRGAIGSLATSPQQAFDESWAGRYAASAVRSGFEAAMADLLRRPVDDALMRQRELLRRLDVVGLRLGEAMDALEDGALKRGA